jgi:aspartyl-tRNA(Asn)/glutamyl-tRNA(Gln) amidotransferase subunit B
LNGYVEIGPDEGDKAKKIRIRRVHLEEDTGKLTHVNGYSLVDLNRAGVPLLEIVTEADINSAVEAYAYVAKLRQLVRYLGVSTGDMEKGAMRCEVNLSLMNTTTGEWGTKVEIKNLNSFRSVRNSIEYEIERQDNVLRAGGTVEQVTVGWDEKRSLTILQRVKEGDTGYRYFPEPDLPPLELDPAWIEDIAASLPELPDQKMARYTSEFGLAQKEARILTEDKAVAEYFEAVVAAAGGRAGVTPKLISNWLSGELFRTLGETESDIVDIRIKPQQLVTLIELVSAKKINQPAAKKVFSIMFETGRAPEEVVQDLGLEQISDEDRLISVAEQVIANNPEPTEKFKDGKDSIMKFLVGQVMRATRGKANPQLAEQVLRKLLQD